MPIVQRENQMIECKTICGNIMIKMRMPFQIGERCLNAFESSVELLVFLQEDEGSNGVRPETNKAGHPAAERPAKAFLAADIA